MSQRTELDKTVGRSRAFLQTVIDAIPDVLLVIDANYGIVLANRAAREMAGGIDPTAGLTCHRFSHHRNSPCDGSDEPCPLRQVIADKAPMTVTHRHYDAKGKESFVEITAAPVFNDKGDVRYIIEACHDITDRKRAEDALQKARDGFENAVRQRTAELTEANERLERLFADLQAKELAAEQLLAKLISAHEDERARIARELHDAAGQSLSALLMQLASVGAMLPAGEAKRQLEGSQSLASSIVEEVRRLMRDLRPSLLDNLGLVPAICSFADSQLNPSGVKFEIAVHGEKRKLPPPMETALFRIFQEAITNIAKHAQATSARIEICFNNSTVVGRITDDGCGFDPVGSRTTWQTFGLLGIEERVTILGGTLRIDSQDGRGTQIHIEVPVPAMATP